MYLCLQVHRIIFFLDYNITEFKLSSSCEYPSRLCDNGTKCIDVDKLCDDRKDCNDGSDEGLRCSDMLCEHSFVCSHDCHNAPEGLICTCPKNLHLQADKINCLATHPCEAWGNIDFLYFFRPKNVYICRNLFSIMYTKRFSV